MSRLTNKKLKTICDGYFVNFASKEEAAKYRMLAESAPKYDEIYRKLADYEDNEEQWLMIVLPVAEGTEVWCIGSCGELCDNWMECEDCKEHEIVFSTNFDRNMVEQWGKTVFATEPEAEEALATANIQQFLEL